MAKKIKLKIMAINWVDPISIDEWGPAKEAEMHDACSILTCGIVVNETGDNFVISANIDLDFGDVSCVMIVPKRYVTKKRVIGYIDGDT